MQQHPLNSCIAQQDRNFRLLQGIAGHAEVSLQSIAVAHHVVADGNDSSLPMALISAVCAAKVQADFKHFRVIDSDM